MTTAGRANEGWTTRVGRGCGWWRRTLALLVVLGAAAFAPAAWAAPNETTLVSRADTATGAKGNMASRDSSISADGRYIAFESTASNLDGDDIDTLSDVYVRDLQSGETTLVSRADTATGAKGNGDSFASSISADGRYVAFRSNATNLDGDDADGILDVYVRDLQMSETTLVSRADTINGVKGNAGSFRPSISADGRYVAFESNASNLDGDDIDTVQDVFVRDLQMSETTLVGRADTIAGIKGNSDSSVPSISADGRYVAFISFASNLDGDDTDTTGDLFVRDVQMSETTLVSRADTITGVKGNSGSFRPSISADGRYVAFDSNATNLDADDTDTLTDVFVRELAVAAVGADCAGVVAAGLPVGCWRFGEDAGSTAVDGSGNDNDGTYLGGVLLGQPGVPGYAPDSAALFDGVDDLVRVPDDDTLDVGSSFSAEGWMKRSSTTRTHTMYNKGSLGLQLVVMAAGSGNQVWLRKATTTTIARSSTGIPADGAYHHVVATMNGAGSAKVYIDGVDVTVAVPGQQQQVIQNTTFPLLFSSGASTAVTFDEFALYDQALNTAEVAAHHAAG